ncbi:MAG TPA: hypothetical protein VMS22_19140 [Candidatus Eisenbacteria bacterium]|nr:hypothetical protein [Candidatus Eisenbacteria bacterium]
MAIRRFVSAAALALALDAAATAQPFPPAIGHQTCVLDHDTSGFLFETAVFFDFFQLSGAIDIDCAAIDPMTGQGACTCTADHIDPVETIPGIGFACITPAGGCSGGRIDCAGGAQLNVAFASDHDIGTSASS